MPHPNYTLITTRSEYHQALRNAFAEVAATGCREVFLSDAQVLDDLGVWAQPHRKLTVLAQDFGDLARRHPRWVAWRRLWSQGVECRANTELEAALVPTMLLAPDLLVVRLVDPLRYRGSVSHEPADMVLAREQLDAVLQRSVEAFPVTVLGL